MMKAGFVKQRCVSAAAGKTRTFIKCKTDRHKYSFAPAAIALLNKLKK